MKKGNLDLTKLRKKLLRLDMKLIKILSSRALVSREIGSFKHKNNVKIVQADFWEFASEIRNKEVLKSGLMEEHMTKIFSQIHKQSIQIQKEVSKQKHE